MKKFLCVLLVLMLLSSVAFAGDYTDISGHWAEKYILSSVGQKIVKGYDDRSFKPEDFVTHAEFITMINRFIGAEKSAEHNIKTVSDEDWFADDVKKAVGEGYLSDGAELLPNEPIMRGVAAGFLAKALNLEADYESLKVFSDFEKIMYAEAGSLVKLGIMNGFEDGTFKPADSLTRAEACKLFYVANKKLNILKEEEKVEEPKKLELGHNMIETVNGDEEVVFTIYGFPECPWCQKLKAYLDEKEISYESQDIRNDKELNNKIFEEYYTKFDGKYDRVYYPTTVISANVDGKEVKKCVVGFNKEEYDKIFEDIKNEKYFVEENKEPKLGHNKIETVNGERDVVFTIYGFDRCPFCKGLKAYLNEKNISYTFEDIRQNQEMKKKVYEEVYLGKHGKFERVVYPTTIISTVIDGKEIRRGEIDFYKEQYDKIFEEIENDTYFK